ncbi:MAG: class I SAM-dependent methyltransferase [Halioglobus sp.]|nr:class I SAM-dependent methyltransferase [Halioglobus sp.]
MPKAPDNQFKNMPKGFGVEWLTRNSFTLNGYKFNIPSSLADLMFSAEQVANSEPNSFYLGKELDILRNYFALFKQMSPKRILDLGVALGGSAVFLQLMAKPERLLALELSTKRADLLDRFIKDESLEESLHVVHGVDQGDARRVKQLCEEHFGTGRSIDLVIDDASHLLAPTRTSFETVFPLIAPGGSYIVEDFATLPIFLNPWLEKAAEHDGARKLVEVGLQQFTQEDHRPLHALAMEAILGSIADPGIINRVIVNKHWLRIIRGGKAIEDPANFDLRAMAVDHFQLTQSSLIESLTPYLR